MTASSSAYVTFVKEQLAPLREMASARFFGGVGLAVGGVQFAMLMDSSLYFAVSDATRPRYEALGSRCFRSEEHTSELQSLMRISYAVFCLTKKNESIHSVIKYKLYMTHASHQ